MVTRCLASSWTSRKFCQAAIARSSNGTARAATSRRREVHARLRCGRSATASASGSGERPEPGPPKPRSRLNLAPAQLVKPLARLIPVLIARARLSASRLAALIPKSFSRSAFVSLRRNRREVEGNGGRDPVAGDCNYKSFRQTLAAVGAANLQQNPVLVAVLTCQGPPPSIALASSREASMGL